MGDGGTPVGDSSGGGGAGVSSRATLIGVWLFAVIAVAGLSYAKWWPYAVKAAGVLGGGALPDTSGGTGGAPSPSLSWRTAWSFVTAYFSSVWVALVAAIVIAAAMESLLPKAWLFRALSAGPRWLAGAPMGGLLALPSMMCTCCSAPMTVSLRRRGARASSALAYWLGNPTLNPAVLIFLAVLLPWQWVTVRIVAGLLLVLVVAPLIGRMAGPPAGLDIPELPGTAESGGAMAVRFFRTAGRLAVTLVPEYVIVVMAVGAVRTWLFPSGAQIASWGVLATLVLAVAGTLFVVPTAGEIPILAGLLSLGIGVAPVGVLLLTLPAMSLPSLVMLRRSFPARVLVAGFAAVVMLGIGCGAALATLTS